MTELVQVTAQYSNAVLLAVLPYVSGFAQKLNLPISTPVTPSQVIEFKCDPRKGQIGGLVTLTNGFRFTFLDGRVCVYRSPQSYFSLQDPELVPKFYSPVKVKQKEALQITCGAIKELGYTDSMFHAELAPKVTPPERIGANYVARYRFQWLDPNWPRPRTLGGIAPVLVDVEVDASTGQIQMLSIASSIARRPSPKIDVIPPLLREDRSDEQKQLSGGMKTEPVSPAYSAAFLEAVLPQLSDFAAKVGLPLRVPLTTDDVDSSRYFCGLLQGKPIAQLFLRNGDRFNYEHGHVVAFYAHDAYRKFPYDGRREDFVGKINMTTNEAIALCERAIKNLEYKTKLPKASLGVGGPTSLGGTNQFTRYIFYWWKPGEDPEFASFEIDMESKAIKSVYIDDPSLWRDPPKIDGPMMAETNAPPKQ